MANVKITALNNLASADVADGDVFVIDDITATETKKITIANLSTAVGAAGFTVSRALVSDGSGDIAVSDVTATEIGYLDGVSSAVQTQIDTKIATTASASNDFVTFTRLNANVNVVQDNVAAIPSSFSNARYITTTANSYNIGVTVASINEVDVYVGGAYQSKKEYVLANSSHNVQFTDATFVAGEDIEIISRT